jgi:hypothetical protein
MSIVYLFIKIYPFFGISLGVLCTDLSRALKRRANKAWVGLMLFSIVFYVSAVVWLIFRGDKNADAWFEGLQRWLHGG